MRSTLLSLVLVSAGALSALAQVLTRPTLGPAELPAAPLAPSEAASPASVEPIELLSVPVESGRLESLVPAERSMARTAVRPDSLARPESSRRLESVGRDVSRPSAASPAPALGGLFDRASLEAPVVAGLGAADESSAVAPQVPSDGSREAASYEEERAAKAGKAESLSPIPGPLAGRLHRELKGSDIRLALFDYDDTLAAWAQPLSQDMGALLRKAMDLGVRVGIITDRRDSKPEGSKEVTILESLAALPNELKAGLLVGGSKGARVVEFQADGTTKLVEEEPGWTPEEKKSVEASLVAVQAKYIFDRVSESEHGYSLIFPAELTKLSADEQLKIAKEAAALWQAELDKVGLHVQTIGRTAKDPVKNPPYLAISKGKMDKSMGVRHIMNYTGVSDPKKVLVVGDSFFDPNKTDLDMANAAPGALTFSVGGTMDPRVPRGFVYDKKGAEGTSTILWALTSGQARGAQAAGRESPLDAVIRNEQIRRLERTKDALRMIDGLAGFAAIGGAISVIWLMFQGNYFLVALAVLAVPAGLLVSMNIDRRIAAVNARINELKGKKD